MDAIFTAESQSLAGSSRQRDESWAAGAHRLNRCCVREMACMGHCSAALHPPDDQTFWICSFMHKHEQTTSCEESHTGPGKDQDRCKVPFVAPQLPCVVSWGSTCYKWPTCGQFQTAEMAWDTFITKGLLRGLLFVLMLN